MRLMSHVVHVRVVRVHLFWHLHASPDRQLRGTTLPQVLVRNALMPLCPWVTLRIGVQVELDIAELVDPTQQVLILVAITTSLAAAHGNAQKVTLADHDSTSDCGHLTIVDHLQRDIAELLRQVFEDGHDFFFVHIWRNIWEDVAPSGFVVSRDCACGAATDGINPRKCGRRFFHGGKYHIPMVLRVRIRDIPFCFLRFYNLVVLYRHRLDVALPEIKGEAASRGILPAFDWPVHSLREGRLGSDDRDLERTIWGTTNLRHRLHLELKLPPDRESLFHFAAHFLRTTKLQR
mmetsp:Transcript_63260/g.135950  ORF Transcript_63260/g.135950 Transcript_63260/m.135950 type:complete len:291 (+) Transcript_63260:299-1171(+)